MTDDPDDAPTDRVLIVVAVVMVVGILVYRFW